MAKGQLSTAERLVSANPAQRRQGQRELASKSSKRQRQIIENVVEIGGKFYSTKRYTPKEIKDLQEKARRREQEEKLEAQREAELAKLEAKKGSALTAGDIVRLARQKPGQNELLTIQALSRTDVSRKAQQKQTTRRSGASANLAIIDSATNEFKINKVEEPVSGPIESQSTFKEFLTSSFSKPRRLYQYSKATLEREKPENLGQYLKTSWGAYKDFNAREAYSPVGVDVFNVPLPTRKQTETLIQPDKKKTSAGTQIAYAATDFIVYGREKPVEAALLVGTPGGARILEAGAKVALGKGAIYGSNLLRAGVGFEKAAKITKAVGTTGKVLDVSVKGGLLGLYGYSKVKGFQAAETDREKGRFYADTFAELSLFGVGAVATRGQTLPFERSREYVRGRFAIRASEYGTPRNIAIVDESAALSKYLTQTRIGSPRYEPRYEYVKGVTGKQLNIIDAKLPKQDLVLQGSITQGAYYNPKLEAQFRTYKGDYGDIDYFIKTGKPIKGLEKISDVHTYGERYITRRSPFTEPEVLTPRGTRITSFQEQSGKLFSGLTTERGGKFYRAEEDVTKLVFQGKFAIQEGQLGYRGKRALNFLTEGYKKIPGVEGLDFNLRVPSKALGPSAKPPSILGFGPSGKGIFTLGTNRKSSLGKSSYTGSPSSFFIGGPSVSAVSSSTKSFLGSSSTLRSPSKSWLPSGKSSSTYSLSPSPSVSPLASPSLLSPSPSPTKKSASGSPLKSPSPLSPSPSPLTDKGTTTSNLFLIKGKKKKGKVKQGYDVLVKQKGKYFKANKRPRTKDSALGLGAYLVDNSASRSFKIRKSKGKSRNLETKNQNYWLFNQNKFREYKRRKPGVIHTTNRFIERTPYLIDSSGELAGITAKGLLALERKRGKALRFF